MEKDIIDNHAIVSATSVEFLDYAVKQGGCLRKLDLLDDDLPPMLRHYPYPLHSWPWFISPETQRTLADCVSQVPGLVMRAVHIEFGNDTQRFCKFYRLADVIGEAVLGGALKTDSVCQRTDAILTDKGFKIVELNLGFTVGGWQIQWMDQQYRKQPELSRFLDKLNYRSRSVPYGYMRHLIRSVQKQKAHGADGKLHVVFIMRDEFFGLDGTQMVGPVFEQALRDHGCEGEIHFRSDLSELVFQADGVYLEGERVGAVVSAHSAPPVQLFRACLTGQITWSDNSLQWVLADKRSLALLYKHRKHPSFSAEDRKTIEAFLPWAAPLSTGRVEFEGNMEDLPSLLLRQKDRFVIKVAMGGKGNDVFVGKYQQPQDWMRLIMRGLAEGNWLVQEFCNSLSFYGQCGDNGYGTFDVVWGVYGFGDEYAGCWLRLMERDSGNGVINSDKGAQESIVYEVAS